MASLEFIDNKNKILKDATKALKCSEKDLVTRIEALGHRIKKKEKKKLQN